MSTPTLIPPHDSMLTMKQVQRLIPLSNTQIYRLMASGQFPRQVRIGLRRVAWRHRDITAWIAERQTTP